jgi:hypothetical protein
MQYKDSILLILISQELKLNTANAQITKSLVKHNIAFKLSVGIDIVIAASALLVMILSKPFSNIFFFVIFSLIGILLGLCGYLSNTRLTQASMALAKIKGSSAILWLGGHSLLLSPENQQLIADIYDSKKINVDASVVFLMIILPLYAMLYVNGHSSITQEGSITVYFVYTFALSYLGTSTIPKYSWYRDLPNS